MVWLVVFMGGPVDGSITLQERPVYYKAGWLARVGGGDGQIVLPSEIAKVGAVASRTAQISVSANVSDHHPHTESVGETENRGERRALLRPFESADVTALRARTFRQLVLRESLSQAQFLQHLTKHRRR